MNKWYERNYTKKTMDKFHKIINQLKWITFITNRFSRIDKKGRAAVTSKLSTLGICLGVMTLIVVLSIMNGFQMSFIDSILELSSYHIQAKVIDQDERELIEYCNNSKYISSIHKFMEAQTLITSEYEKEGAAIIRAVAKNSYKEDSGFNKEMNIRYGDFNLEQENSIVIGSTLARNLNVGLGDTVCFFVLSGSDDVELFSSERVFTITGIFSSGYSELNSSYCYISLEDGQKYFGENANQFFGIKLKDKNKDDYIISLLNKNFSKYKFNSWREYNKSFFGTLRIEKNMLMLLVALIFIVVGINIYNGMRRLVFERKSEIAILSALGSSSSKIKMIFILRGAFSGLVGAFIGAILGLIISYNTPIVFTCVSKILYGFEYFFTIITSPQNIGYLQENSSYALYATIGAKVFYSEVFFVFLFGILSPLIASWIASKNVLKMTIAEVLHHD